MKTDVGMSPEEAIRITAENCYETGRQAGYAQAERDIAEFLKNTISKMCHGVGVADVGDCLRMIQRGDHRPKEPKP